MDNFKTIKSYIAAQRKDVQALLTDIYNIIKTHAPNQDGKVSGKGR